MTTKQTFKIKIGGVDYSSYITYPVSLTEKNLDESLNIAGLTLGRTSILAPFKPNRQVVLELYVDDILTKTYSFLLLSDVVTKIGFTTLYDHQLSLIEYTHLLSQVILPDFTITRIKDFYMPTLLTASTRVTALFKELTGLQLNFGAETISKLSAQSSPEWTFTRQTALEALRMIFSLVKIVPVVDITEGQTYDTIGHVGLLDDIAAGIEGFGFKQEAYSPETYKTALYSNVQNFITGEDDTITEPANGWLSVRSPDGFKIQEDNAFIPTSRPIYKINKLDVARYLIVKASSSSTGGVDVFVNVPHSIVPMEWLTDINSDDFLYEKDFWDTKENTDVYGERGASFYYKQGEKNIYNLSFIAPSWSSWFPNAQSWRNIVKEIIPTASAVIDASVKPAHRVDAEALALAYWETLHGVPSNVQYTIGFEEGKSHWTSYDNSEVKVHDMQFRITYTPLINTNLFTYRERKYGDDDEIQSFQYYNQTATVIDNEVLANLHDKVIKRGSGTSLNLTYIHNNFSEILTLGSRVDDYIITSYDLTYGYSGIKVIYNLDKFYAKLQKYVAILEEYRQYSIPNENIVTRQLTLNRFAKFSSSIVDGLSGINIDSYKGDNSLEVNLMKLNNTTLSTTNFAFNNSLVFEATLESNASAGPQSAYYDANTRVDKPTSYTDTNGMISGLQDIKFGTDFTNFDLTASQALPLNTDLLATEFFSLTNEFVHKDAREILSLSLQIHHIDTTNKIYINPGMAIYNGTTGGIGLNDDTIEAAFFTVKPHNQKVLPPAEVVAIQFGGFSKTANSVAIQRPSNNTGTSKPAWGYVKQLSDGTYEILFWVDEETANGAMVNPYYINFDTTY